ncbi:MAG: heme lyase CcmF/NrfE family subunit [Actinobacteria bacterium]|nr:heme lyase CcmF/NrfE family subunit [Ilumatobacteraceae bacterium]MDA0300381.1 heme lyase CcmF/NrfE family subunit [Actinomycetota bacterium]MDA2993765.1 heme lyase CcmF/NrfE family subunit [Actinomycetota bacterium]
MSAALGNAGLLIVLVAASVGALATAVAIIGGNLRALRQAPIYAAVIVGGAVLAVISMQWALFSRDYSIDFVQRVGSSTTPTLYNIAAMWSALEGSILLWVIVLALFTGGVALRFVRRRDDELVAWALVVMYVVMTFFALVSFGPASPFAPGATVPIGFDGPGPNPLLQNHILVLFHPPLLYLGYVGFTVPFAFAIAALITGRVGEGWLLETRRWALLSWGFLTIGILLGGWWSYEVLGWSGVWAWDPVENASFLPWLTGTAYIHSVLVQQRRGMLRVWNLSLLIATFALTILGTFLTRSGVINSVHAFAAGEIDGYLLGFFGIVVLVSLGLIGWRGDALRAPGRIDSPMSREGAFLANNVVFALFAFIVLLGTVFPLLVEVFQDRQTVVGAPYFDRLSMPIGLVLLFLMAVAPVLPWRRASTETLRDRLFWPAWCGVGALAIAVAVGADRLAPLLAFLLGGFAAGAAGRQLLLATRRQGLRGLVGRANGGMLVHIGVILIAVALAASNSYTHSATLTIGRGERVEWAGHSFEFVGVSTEVTARADVVMADVLLDDKKVYAPAVTTYLQQGMTVPTPSVRTGLTSDVYLTIDGNDPPATDASEVVLRVFVKPMVLWLWIGGAVMAIGTVLSALPSGRSRRPTDPTSALVSGGQHG